MSSTMIGADVKLEEYSTKRTDKKRGTLGVVDNLPSSEQDVLRDNLGLGVDDKIRVADLIRSCKKMEKLRADTQNLENKNTKITKQVFLLICMVIFLMAANTVLIWAIIEESKETEIDSNTILVDKKSHNPIGTSQVEFFVTGEAILSLSTEKLKNIQSVVYDEHRQHLTVSGSYKSATKNVTIIWVNPQVILSDDMDIDEKPIIAIGFAKMSEEIKKRMLKYLESDKTENKKRQLGEVLVVPLYSITEVKVFLFKPSLIGRKLYLFGGYGYCGYRGCGGGYLIRVWR